MNWNYVFNNMETMLEHRTWAQPSDFTYALDLGCVDDYDQDFDSKVVKYYVVGANWICTDERVGLAVYLFNGIPVAVSTQTARKSDEYVTMVSKSSAEVLRQYILSLSTPTFQICDDLLEEFPSSWFPKSTPAFA